MRFSTIFGFLCVLILSTLQPVRADQMDTAGFASEWAAIKYQTVGDAQVSALESLNQRLREATSEDPNDAGLLAWQGTALSTYAGLQGGLKGLKTLEEAKTILETSLKLNEKAEGALAHTILGAMYYRVPGWPVGFKDLNKAKEHLERALVLNPNSIDAHYFYADFCQNTKDFAKAREHFQIVLNLPVRAEAEVADLGRKAEAKKALADLPA